MHPYIWFIYPYISRRSIFTYASIIMWIRRGIYQYASIHIKARRATDNVCACMMFCIPSLFVCMDSWCSRKSSGFTGPHHQTTRHNTGHNMWFAHKAQTTFQSHWVRKRSVTRNCSHIACSSNARNPDCFAPKRCLLCRWSELKDTLENIKHLNRNTGHMIDAQAWLPFRTPTQTLNGWNLQLASITTAQNLGCRPCSQSEKATELIHPIQLTRTQPLNSISNCHHLLSSCVGKWFL